MPRNRKSPSTSFHLPVSLPFFPLTDHQRIGSQQAAASEKHSLQTLAPASQSSRTQRTGLEAEQQEITTTTMSEGKTDWRASNFGLKQQELGRGAGAKGPLLVGKKASSTTPSFPSQPEGKIGLPRANPRGSRDKGIQNKISP